MFFLAAIIRKNVSPSGNFGVATGWGLLHHKLLYADGARSGTTTLLDCPIKVQPNIYQETFAMGTPWASKTLQHASTKLVLGFMLDLGFLPELRASFV